MTLIIQPEGQPARALEPTDMRLEATLQDFIVENPQCLPLTELRSELQFLVVAKELAAGSGSIDAVGVDDEGNVYLLETKLYRNTDKRKVVAQVLDYGAALWRDHGDPRTFIEKLDTAAERLLGKSLEKAVAGHFGLDTESSEALLQEVESVVREGRFRFIVVLDRLDDHLKDLVSYLNENSRFDLYAVEMRFYRFEGHQAAIPRLYGAEARKPVTGVTSRQRWDEDSYFADAKTRLSTGQVEALHRLYDFLDGHADRVTWGTGGGKGSFNPKYDHISPKSILSAYSDGRVDFNFNWLHQEGEPLPQPVRELADRLREIPGLALPEGYENSHHQTRVADWAGHVDRLIAALRETLTADEG